MDKKYKKYIIIALIFSLVAILQASVPPVGVQWVVNNTNKAPNVPGHSPGTGERIGDNTTYWTNSSPIQIFLYSHANTTGQAAEIHLFINGTKVSDTSGRPLGVAETSNRSIVATIPQYANYSVEMVNYHHYEWYEYPILTGEVTTTITTSTGGGTTGAGCVGHSGNCSFDMVLLNHLATNTTGGFVNILLHDGFENTSGNFRNVLDITGSTISMSSSEVVGVNSTQIVMSPLQFLIQNTNSINNYLLATQNEMVLSSGSANYSFNQTYADIHGSNITHVNNTNMTGVLLFPTRSNESNISGGFTITDNAAISQNAALFSVNRWYDGTAFQLGTYNAPGYTLSFSSSTDTTSAGRGFRVRYFATGSTAASTVFQTNEAWTNMSSNLTINPAQKPSGIQMYSPDGNDWCVTVNNAGALVVSTERCRTD